METLGLVQPGTEVSEIRGFVEVYKTQAQIRYHPTPDPRVRVVLFRAREPLADFLNGMPESLRNDETWGWQQYSDGPPVVEYVPGNHLTMMTHPHVGQLAQRLRAALSPRQGTGKEQTCLP
jgi:thioesterase domain-containing protein